MATTVFGFNLFSTRDKGIIISNDSGDLELNFEIFSSEILPRFIGKKIEKSNFKLKSRGDNVIFESEDIHIKRARNQVKRQLHRNPNEDNSIVGGLCYNPMANRFSCMNISESIIEYFKGEFSMDYVLNQRELLISQPNGTILKLIEMSLYG